MRHPSRGVRGFGAIGNVPAGNVRRRECHYAALPARQIAPALRTGKSPARCFRPCLRYRSDSCHRSSRLNPSAANRVRQSASRARWRGRNAGTGWQFQPNAPASRSTNLPRHSPHARSGNRVAHPAPPCRPWSKCNGTSPAATTSNHRNIGCVPHGRTADATSVAHRLPQTDALHTAANVRGLCAVRHEPTPLHPATGRGNRMRRRTGNNRCVPTSGNPAFGITASRWRAYSPQDQVFPPALCSRFAPNNFVPV